MSTTFLTYKHSNLHKGYCNADSVALTPWMKVQNNVQPIFLDTKSNFDNLKNGYFFSKNSNS